jgi:RNA polymerase sigma factor (sigma-70 family)
MTEGKSDSYWPAADERLVVEEMMRDRCSKHWEACDKFVKRRVYAKAKNIPNDHLEDICQEVMVKVTKSLPTFNFQCSLKTWLNTIIEHSIIDMHRRLRNQEPFNAPLGGPLNENDREGEIVTESEAGSAEDISMINDDLRNAMAALLEYTKAHANSIRNRRIIQMVIFDEYTLAEAAKVAGCNAPVVGYVVRSAQRYVREKMGQRL